MATTSKVRKVRASEQLLKNDTGISDRQGQWASFWAKDASPRAASERNLF
jgi:hypothetical protein